MSGPVTHELKTDPLLFDAVWRGVKTHEIRFNDRNFKVGDNVILRETRYSGEQMRSAAGYDLIYTGRQLRRCVTHVLFGYGLAPGWCVLSIGPSSWPAPPLKKNPS